MLTADFTGDYDYEKTEAESEADTILADLADGYYSLEQFEQAKAKILAHWAKVFQGEPESMAEFTKYFNERLS